jgi:hypothetical protein
MGGARDGGRNLTKGLLAHAEIDDALLADVVEQIAACETGSCAELC